MTELLGPASQHRPHEIELKYRVEDLAAAERLVEADALGSLKAMGGRPRAVQVEDHYVDTSDGSLARAGYVVRLRQRGDETIVTVKSTGHEAAAGGAYRRLELEGPADRVAPAADWLASDARALILEHAGDKPLVERVTIRQLRRTRVFRAGASRVELSLDEIDVVDRSRIVTSFVELEAELVKGSEGILGAVAAELDGVAGLARATESKLHRALAAIDKAARDADAEVDVDTDAVALVDDVGASPPIEPVVAPEPFVAPEPEPVAPDEPVPAGDAGTDPAATVVHEAPSEPKVPRLSVGKSPGVTAEDHLAEAGRKVMRFHLARMFDYEPGTRSGVDPEDLHKMRVATRRQRAAWRVFGEAYRPGRTRRYRNGLREIAGRLGAVRDLDVLLEAADAYRADLPSSEQRALEPLLAAWRSHREDARTLLIRELDSDGYRRWLDDYVAFVRTEGLAVRPFGPVEPHRVRDTAPSRIWAAYENVRAYEPVLRWADVETLHDLRIAGKWLRYTLEFVREALGPESAPLIARVTALQDHLGLMHDADVSASMARTFLVERSATLSPLESAAIGHYLVDRERETARLRRMVGGPWRGIAGISYRRTLGRVVAGL